MLAESRLDHRVPSEEFGKKDRVSPGQAFVLAAVGELGGGIGARHVEQPIVGYSVDSVRRYQGLRNQAYYAGGNIGFTQLCVGCNRADSPKREVPSQNR